MFNDVPVMLSLQLYLLYVISFEILLCNGMDCEDSEVTVLESDPVCFLCHVIPPKPSVLSWYRKYPSSPKQLVDEDRLFVDALGTLFFSHVLPEDTGVYGCSFSDQESIYFGSNITLNVTRGSTQREPRLLWSSPNMTQSSRYPQELVCAFAGRPVPNITWWRDGEMITAGVQTDGMKSHLSLSGVIPHTASYTCMGTNGAGKDKQNINLFVADNKEMLLTWIWSGLGLVALISTIATGRCCHKWCSWKRKRREMLRKEAEGYRMGHEEKAERYRMVHEEKAEGYRMGHEEVAEGYRMGHEEKAEGYRMGHEEVVEISKPLEVKSHEDPSRPVNHDIKFQESQDDTKMQEEANIHGLLREETEKDGHQFEEKKENELRVAMELKAKLKCVQKTQDDKTNNGEAKNSGKSVLEKIIHPTGVGQEEAKRTETNTGKTEEMNIHEDSPENTKNGKMNIDVEKRKAENRNHVKKTEEKVPDLDDDDTKVTNMIANDTGMNVISAGSSENNIGYGETKKSGEEEDTSGADTERPGEEVSSGEVQAESEA